MVFEKIHESGATTVATLMEVVHKLIDIDKPLVNQFDSDTKRDVWSSGTATDPSSKLRKRSSEVLMADKHHLSTFNIDEFNVVLNSPYTFHKGGTHTVRERS
jgi:hypothetical protein